MNIRHSLLALAAPLALLTVSGCDTGFTANVARFQRLPAPQGQTFAVQSANPQNNSGIEFGMYAQSVTGHLAQLGYRPVAPGSAADLIVQVGYGVDQGQQRVTTTPGFGCGYGGWGGGFGGFGGGWGGGFGGGWGGGWGGRGWRYGWDGGFGGGFGCPDVESYTIYSSQLTMTITRADGARLFEGRARAHSATDDLTKIVPNLIEAMFTGFPGNSGQDIRITIPPRKA